MVVSLRQVTSSREGNIPNPSCGLAPSLSPTLWDFDPIAKSCRALLNSDSKITVNYIYVVTAMLMVKVQRRFSLVRHQLSVMTVTHPLPFIVTNCHFYYAQLHEFQSQDQPVIPPHHTLIPPIHIFLF